MLSTVSLTDSRLSGGSDQDEDEPASTPDLRVDEDSDLLGAEQKQAGGLAWTVYATYWSAVGGALASSVLVSLLLMQGLDHKVFQTLSRETEGGDFY